MSWKYCPLYQLRVIRSYMPNFLVNLFFDVLLFVFSGRKSFWKNMIGHSINIKNFVPGPYVSKQCLHSNLQIKQCCEGFEEVWKSILTLSWRMPLSYRCKSIDLQSKWMDWFLYYRNLRHELSEKWSKKYFDLLFLPGE